GHQPQPLRQRRALELGRGSPRQTGGRPTPIGARPPPCAGHQRGHRRDRGDRCVGSARTRAAARNLITAAATRHAAGRIDAVCREPANVRNTTLHGVIEAFVAEAAMALCAETASGAEIPFELVDTSGGPRSRVPLYCYRPLTGAFISDRLSLLSRLPTYPPAARSLLSLEGVDAYLRQRGESRLPSEPRGPADAGLPAVPTRLD